MSWQLEKAPSAHSSGSPALRKPSITIDGVGVHDAPELDEDAVTRPLDHTAVMHGDGWIDQIAPQRSQAGKRPLLVGASKPAVSDHIRRKDGCEFPGLRHGSPFTTRQTSTIARRPGQGLSTSR
jgi:hypothetical protein